MSLADSIGYMALALNLYSMSSKNERRLRMFSVVANLMYIVYGIVISAIPIILGCAVAVLLHTYRLYKMKHKNYGTNTAG